LKRWKRQIRLEEIGARGQEKISRAHVVASSEIEARYLAAAGVASVSMIAREDDRDARFGALDPAAREIARGAHSAIGQLKKILE
jgi:hypothetical protein